LSIKIMTAAWDTPGLTASQKIVLLSLSDNANDEGVCWPSMPTMCRRCDLSDRSIQRAILDLEAGGHVTRKERPGRSSVFMVHPRHGVTPDTVTPTPDTVTGDPRHGDAPPPTQCRTESSREPSIEPSENRQAAKRSARQVPDDWSPSEAALAKIASYDRCKGLDIQLELDKMRNYDFKTPRRDWNRTFVNWCLTASRTAKAPATTTAAEIIRFYVEDQVSGNLEIVKVPFLELKPWEQAKLRALQKMFKSKTIFYRSELRD
jgi:hypothetical protein